MKKIQLLEFRRLILPAFALTLWAEFGGQAQAATVYAFAQQKVYNMTINSTAGNGNLVPAANMNISTNDSANLSGFIGVTNQLPALDAAQSKLGIFATPGSPSGRVNPVENYINTAPFASSGGINTLAQANPTNIGAPNGVDITNPISTNFNSTDHFTRSDVFTAYPSGDPAGGIIPGSGQTPAGYPLNGQGIPSNQLFVPVGTGPTVGLDVVAEGLLNSTTSTIGTATSSWLISGTFTLTTAGAATFDFEMVERLVVYADSPFITQANANNTLSLLVSDENNIPVATPTSQRTLTAPNQGQITYNANSLAAGNIWTGPNQTNPIIFQTGILRAGNYHYSIQGLSQVDLKIVPEPSTYALMGVASATFGGLAWKRRRQQKPAVVTA